MGLILGYLLQQRKVDQVKTEVKEIKQKITPKEKAGTIDVLSDEELEKRKTGEDKIEKERERFFKKMFPWLPNKEND